MNMMNIITLSISSLTLVLLFVLLLKNKDTKDLELLLKQNNETRSELLLMLENQRSGLNQQISQLDSNLKTSLSKIENQSDNLSQKVDYKLEKIREDNEKRLEAMRETVEQKLSVTLNTRLSESFKLVSSQLETVHTSLGEMKSLSSGVGDLTRMLGNIKTRGTWGELQAENILEEILINTQWEKNVITRKGSNYRVEFAIKLPGKGETPVYLPIDAKFPKEDYQRLQDFALDNDKKGIDSSIKALTIRIEEEAKSIREKYIDPPHTTDFAILFLPLEGLYAEVISIPGLFEKLQQKYRVIISGPTTFSALINSLQLGFRTVALEKRSEEVWKVLSSVKTEFERFGLQVDKVQQRLNQASSSIETLGTRTRVMRGKLKAVENTDEEIKIDLPTSSNEDFVMDLLNKDRDKKIENPLFNSTQQVDQRDFL